MKRQWCYCGLILLLPNATQFTVGNSQCCHEACYELALQSLPEDMVGRPRVVNGYDLHIPTVPHGRDV